MITLSGDEMEVRRKKSRTSYHKNKSAHIESVTVYRSNHVASCRKWRKVYEDRHKKDPVWYLNYRTRRALCKVLHNPTWKKSKLVDAYCGGDVFCVREHFESLFQPGMSRDNYGKDGWHVDHIRPCIQFNLADEVEFRKCWHYTNLQPLWAKDNLLKRKHDVAPLVKTHDFKGVC